MSYCENDPGDEACVVAWDLIGQQALYALYFWLVFAGLAILYWIIAENIVGALWNDPRRFLELPGKRRLRRNSTILRWKLLNPRTAYVLHVVFQSIPSFITSFLWIRRAVLLQVDVADLALDAALSVLFLAILIARWARSPDYLGTILDHKTIVDCLSLGSFIGLFVASCRWPIESAEFVTGANCVGSGDNNTIPAKTWFTFGFLRAIYVKDVTVSLERIFPQGLYAWLRQKGVDFLFFIHHPRTAFARCVAWCKGNQLAEGSEQEVRSTGSQESGWSLSSILTRVRNNVAVNALNSEKKTKSNASAAAAGQPYTLDTEGYEQVVAPWSSTLWNIVKLASTALIYIFILSCIIYVLEIVGEFPEVQEGILGNSDAARFWIQYSCSDGTRATTSSSDCSSETFSPFVSFYYLLITFSTVGYGDFSPTTSASRLATLLFMIFGIVVFANSANKVLSIVSRKKRRPKPRFDPSLGQFIIILGSPSKTQLSEFLNEIYAAEKEYQIVNSLDRKTDGDNTLREGEKSPVREYNTIHSYSTQELHGLRKHLMFNDTGRNEKRLYVVILGKLDSTAEEWLLWESNYAHPVYREKHVGWKSSIDPNGGSEDTEYRAADDSSFDTQKRSKSLQGVRDVITDEPLHLEEVDEERTLEGKHSDGRHSVVYLEGDPTDANDFSRAALERSKAIFVLPEDVGGADEYSKTAIPSEDYLSLQMAISAKTYITRVAKEKAIVRIEALKDTFSEVYGVGYGKQNSHSTGFLELLDYMFSGGTSDEARLYFRQSLRALLLQYSTEMTFNIRLLLTSYDTVQHARIMGIPRRHIILRGLIRYSLMGCSCIYPGMSTLIGNFLTTNAPPFRGGESPSKIEYKQGSLFQVYSCRVPGCLLGLTLTEAACCIFELTGNVRREYSHDSSLSDPSALVEGWVSSDGAAGRRGTVIRHQSDFSWYYNYRCRRRSTTPKAVKFYYGKPDDCVPATVHLIGCSFEDETEKESVDRRKGYKAALGMFSEVLSEGMTVFGLAADASSLKKIQSEGFASRVHQWRRHMQSSSRQETATTSTRTIDIDAAETDGGEGSPVHYLDTVETPHATNPSARLLHIWKDIKLMEDADYQRITSPPKEKIMTGRHLVIVCGPDVSINHLTSFLRPIWTTAFDGSGCASCSALVEFVVVLHPNPPEGAAWNDLVIDRNRRGSSLPVYLVNGSASNNVDLKRAGIFSCSVVAILSAGGGYFHYDKTKLGNSGLDELTSFLVIRYLHSGGRTQDPWLIAEGGSTHILHYLQVDQASHNLQVSATDQRGNYPQLQNTNTWIDETLGALVAYINNISSITKVREEMGRVVRVSPRSFPSALARHAETFPATPCLLMLGHSCRLRWHMNATLSQIEVQRSRVADIQRDYRELEGSFSIKVRTFLPEQSEGIDASTKQGIAWRLMYASTVLKHKLFYRMCKPAFWGWVSKVHGQISELWSSEMTVPQGILRNNESNESSGNRSQSAGFQASEEYASGAIHSSKLAEAVLATSLYQPEVVEMLQRLMRLPKLLDNPPSLRHRFDYLPIVQLITVPPSVWEDVALMSMIPKTSNTSPDSSVLDFALPTYHQVYIYLLSHYNVFPLGLFRHYHYKNHAYASDEDGTVYPYVYTAPDPNCRVLPSDGIYVVTQTSNPLLQACVTLQRSFRSKKSTSSASSA
eukprot:gb/GECG01000985.1/.p1 GENE.gb/GECG01000985.1/~~gb/GECG01000985.1/.p1  ORF type:complete len:1674 (+),score=163.49 gb/GECG01000985.1/:1-5022(+)